MDRILTYITRYNILTCPLALLFLIAPFYQGCAKAIPVRQEEPAHTHKTEPLPPISTEPATERLNYSPTLPQDVQIAPKESELSPNAKETLAYLLFLRAIMDEDEAALLDVIPLLQAAHAPADIWQDGGVWLWNRKSPNSVIFLEEALNEHKDDLSLNILYSEALSDHNMTGRGVERMREFVARHPDELNAKLQLALMLVKDKQFAEAQKILTAIPARERTPLMDYYQAKILMGIGKRSEAIPYLRKAVKGMSEFDSALAELAMAYEEEGNLREARGIYEKLQKMNFSPQQVGLRLVDLSLRLKQPDKALQYIRRGPDSLPFKLTAANMLIEARHYLQAENILKQIVASGRAPTEVYLVLADLTYEHRRNLNAALAWLDKIPDAATANPKVIMLRSQLMAEAGKPGEAIEQLQTAVANGIDSPELYDLLARLLAREKKNSDAIKIASEAATRWPDNPQVLFLYGSLLDESGDRPKALSVMENLLAKNPNHYQAMNYIGYTLAEEDREIDRAIKLLTKANELSPDQAYIIDSLAWAHFKAGNTAQALELIRRAVELEDRADAAIWEHYGDIAHKEGKKDEARRAWRKALQLKPANADAVRGKLSKI